MIECFRDSNLLFLNYNIRYSCISILYHDFSTLQYSKVEIRMRERLSLPHMPRAEDPFLHASDRSMERWSFHDNWFSKTRNLGNKLTRFGLRCKLSTFYVICTLNSANFCGEVPESALAAPTDVWWSDLFRKQLFSFLTVLLLSDGSMAPTPLWLSIHQESWCKALVIPAWQYLSRPGSSQPSLALVILTRY